MASSGFLLEWGPFRSALQICKQEIWKVFSELLPHLLDNISRSVHSSTSFSSVFSTFLPQPCPPPQSKSHWRAVSSRDSPLSVESRLNRIWEELRKVGHNLWYVAFILNFYFQKQLRCVYARTELHFSSRIAQSFFRYWRRSSSSAIKTRWIIPSHALSGG